MKQNVKAGCRHFDKTKTLKYSHVVPAHQNGFLNK